MPFNEFDEGLAPAIWPPLLDDIFDSAPKSSLSNEPAEGDVIVVTGTRNSSGGLTWTQTSGSIDFSGLSGSNSEISPPSEDASPPDEAIVEIRIEIPLNASQQEAIEKLKATIAAIEQAIRNLPANAVLVLPNGAQTTAAELKDIWSKLDFVINDHTDFENESGLGQADYNYGDPLVTFNISTVVDYNTSPASMNYLVAHEIGHLSMAGDPNGNPYYTD